VICGSVDHTGGTQRPAEGLRAVLASALIFAVCAPLARTLLAKSEPHSDRRAALAVSDLITALVLFGQFAILRTCRYSRPAVYSPREWLCLIALSVRARPA
jgi:hypothetical protein